MRWRSTFVSSVTMLAVASAVGLSGVIRAQDKAVPTNPGSAGDTGQLDEKASREVMQVLQQVKAAVRKRDQGDKEKARTEEAKAPLPPRPSRTVTPPSLTSADIDRMLQKYLAKTSPKVEPAELTSDVEFVRRVHLDLAGALPPPARCSSSSTTGPRTSGPGWSTRSCKAPNSPATGRGTGATWCGSTPPTRT